MRHITRTIWILSLVSMLTDVATEMLYPVLPIYLRHIGFSIALIGLLEGIAEATAGFSKGYFGNLSDQTGRRLPFVRLGYLLSAVSKPLMVAFVHPAWVFLVRTADRLGKGVRTAARDALLSDEATNQTKGRVFGFHRALDTLGAVIGPALALVFLWLYPENYRMLFLIAFVPGILAVSLTFLLKDKPVSQPVSLRSVHFFRFLGYWKSSPPLFRRVVAGLLLFALFNSSDIFLLLKLSESGLDDRWVIGAFIFYNLVYAVFALPLGMLADRIGLRITLVAGFGLFALVYAGMAMATELWMFGVLFLLYGVYSAATEGITRAWISNITYRADTATALGFFAGFQSICLFLASALTGLVWYAWGSRTAFLLTAGVALVVTGYFLLMREARPRNLR